MHAVCRTTAVAAMAGASHAAVIKAVAACTMDGDFMHWENFSAASTADRFGSVHVFWARGNLNFERNATLAKFAG